MKHILGLIGLIITFWGAYYFFIKKDHVSLGDTVRHLLSQKQTETPATNPLDLYTHIKDLSTPDQMATIKNTLGTWIHNPQFPITYPKNWKSTTVTLEKTTFKVLTIDTHTPPAFYVSFEFPRTLMKKVTAIKCLGLDPKSPTDWCLVGNNDQMNAYFQMITLMKNSSLLNPQSAMNMIEGVTPTVNF